MARILFVEDDEHMRKVLKMGVAASAASHEAEMTTSAEEALQRAACAQFDIAVVDVHLPKMSGIDLIPHLLRISPGIAIVAISGGSTTQMAIEAMKRGAIDFLLKPFEIESFLSVIDATAARLTNKTARSEKTHYSQIIAAAPIMQGLLTQVTTIAPFNTTILITGETGTGKEMIARAVHQQSNRAKKPFVALNCAAIPEQLLEDELFGHVKGAFTGAHQAREGRFEQADGGTLFLDEIGDMSIHLQAKLLRVLQEREFEKLGSSRSTKVEVRIVAATSANLEKKIQDGRFRADLYYRLNVVRLNLPPLRERPEDVMLLAEHLLARFCEGAGLPIKSLSEEASAALAEYSWPGNVRQLQNAMERAAALSGLEKTILLKDLPEELQKEAAESAYKPISIAAVPSIEEISPEQGLNFDAVVMGIERELLCRSLEKAGGNKMQAAKMLNMKRTTFVEKLKRLGIEKGEAANG
jgi:DNA-binding NtrC family response regulator